MKEISYNKLVRDRIPEIIEKNGDECQIQTMDDWEFKKKLKEKLVEEASELTKVKSKEEIINELVDISEVIQAIQSIEKITVQEVEIERRKKKKKRGGFKKQIKLIRTKEK